MKREKISKSAATGAVALIFLILGFQIAVFLGNVFGPVREWGGDRDKASEQDVVAASEDVPVADVADSGRSVQPEQFKQGGDSTDNVDKVSVFQRVADATNAPAKRRESFSDSRTVISEKIKKRQIQSFPFNPNTISHDSLVMLGFSDRQAEVIENYRNKGGKFKSPADFAKMYVVDSATFARLKCYIDIPKVDLNTADSAALVSLKGIGPYYAKKILDYRQKLGGGFYDSSQLLEIEGIDKDKFDGLQDAVTVARPFRMDIWNAEQWQLERHPYIGKFAAKGIIRFKSVADSSQWNLKSLIDNNILQPADTVYFY